MATDFGEKEREFIDGLKENSGRSLDEWMQAISEAKLPHRNDIIDWLRREGLMFSKASWLERIHHNGGRPIYAGVPKDALPKRPLRRLDARVPAVAPQPAPAASPTPSPAMQSAGVQRQSAIAPAVAGALPPVPAGDLDAVLAKAKAYRPLAQLVLATIRQVSPAADLGVRESAVAIGAPAPFAVLGIATRELRLHLALGDHPFDEVVKKGQAGGGLGKGEALSHMLVLNDARQVDARFSELVALAAGRASG
ncbi:MAG: DUF5655 domain-containing protein [Hyphomicrobium sp.]